MKAKASQFSRGDIDAVPLSGRDRLILIDAARFYARHHGRGIKRKPISDPVAEMIAAKEAAGVNELYLADLRYRLDVFRDAFQCDVNALVPDDVKAFFERMRLSPRSYNNFLRTLRTFFAFAQNHGWLSKEAELLARVEKRKEKSGAGRNLFVNGTLHIARTRDDRPCAVSGTRGLRWIAGGRDSPAGMGGLGAFAGFCNYRRA